MLWHAVFGSSERYCNDRMTRDSVRGMGLTSRTTLTTNIRDGMGKTDRKRLHLWEESRVRVAVVGGVQSQGGSRGGDL